MKRMVILAVTAAVILCLGIVVLMQRPTGTDPGTDPGTARDTACRSVPAPAPEAVQGAAGLQAADTGSEAGAPTISGKRPAFGVATDGGFGSPSQWDEVARTVGESPSLIMAYSSFLEPVPLAGLEAVAARGATPVLTWEPWDPAAGPDQTRFGLTTIVDGHHDPYLREWANTLRSYGEPVLIRFAHEMNFPWYPWGAGTSGNAPEDYVESWRHVHDLFEDAGVTNVSWVWNPQAPTCDSGELRAFFPGNDYVDVVALDAYNWGTTREGERWLTPEELFAEGLRQVRELAPEKPILIGETSSTESGGSKADWITELVAYLGAQPDVEGFIWFHYRKESDWRFTSSDSARDAFEAALSTR
ncbi:beta-mannanase [Arthrobacter sp. NamB2]|uniref:glycoside hydrolase family 26 protein n=1 Tax=Arthrobacter sp. NamB2 TaxID=2576035 RepID=UPI0010C9B518|nr:glycosyl hydrolase [Arthrobacter sp. NamB2]TKV28331.1 beta-mannanase [Arthrobacter sp. NamB2]